MTNPLLSGVRVLDLSRLLPGPFCALYLAQLGAEVIKIEEPKGGDYTRTLSPELFALVNRGKKSVTLDLKHPADVAVFKKLATNADVVLESFRPGVMDRLGCGYETLRALNPKLVYAALTGYGQTGPLKNFPGHDMNYRGYSGELAQAGAVGTPPPVGNFQVADLAGGALTCAVSLLAALIGARASGQGSLVDVSMTDGTLALQVAALASLRTMGQTLPRGGDALSGGVPNYAVYEAQDGHFVALGTVEHKFFAAFCQRAGRPDLLKLPMAMGEKGQVLRHELAALFKTRTRDEWDRLMAFEDTCVTGIYSLEESLELPNTKARAFVEQVGGKPAVRFPVHFSHAQTSGGASPGLGEHNAMLDALRG